MDDMQQKLDKHQEDADHEYKDLLKLQVICTLSISMQITKINLMWKSGFCVWNERYFIRVTGGMWRVDDCS